MTKAAGAESLKEREINGRAKFLSLYRFRGSDPPLD